MGLGHTETGRVGNHPRQGSAFQLPAGKAVLEHKVPNLGYPDPGQQHLQKPVASTKVLCTGGTPKLLQGH